MEVRHPESALGAEGDEDGDDADPAERDDDVVTAHLGLCHGAMLARRPARGGAIRAGFSLGSGHRDGPAADASPTGAACAA
ncbi:hypothetical protein GCM10023066_38150 [Nocardioides kongjuensis]